jgi:hypothetical protein
MIFGPFAPLSISQIFFQHSSCTWAWTSRANIFLWQKKITKCTDTIKRAQGKMKLSIRPYLHWWPVQTWRLNGGWNRFFLCNWATPSERFEQVRTGSARFTEFWKSLNLELNLGFGSANFTATEPDFWSGSGSVQVRQHRTWPRHHYQRRRRGDLILDNSAVFWNWSVQVAVIWS